MLINFLNNIIERYNTGNPVDSVSEKTIIQKIRRNRLSTFFFYRAYDPINRIYHNSDGSCGFIWEVSPICYASTSIYNGLKKIIDSLPLRSVFQIILHADNHIEPIIDEYLSLRMNDYSEITKRTADLFRDGADNGFKSISGLPARNFRCFVALKLCDDDLDTELRFIRDSVFESLQGAYLVPRYLEPQGLCDWLQRIFVAKNDLPNSFSYNDQIAINQQILIGGTSTGIRFDHIKIGDHVAKVQTLKDYPINGLDDLTINQVVGGIFGAKDDANQKNFPFIVSTNIIKEDLRYKVHGKTNLMIFQEKKGSSAGIKYDRQNEMLEIARDLDRGTTYVRVITTIVSFSKNIEASNENAARIKRLWENQGFTINNDRGILVILLLISLPFGFYNSKAVIEFLERDRIMSSEAAARLLPIQGDFKGLGKPISLFLGRKGQTIPLDIFDPDVPNQNVIIVAATGQGKSYLMNRLLVDLRSVGAILRVFDLGRSYKKLSDVLNGKFIEFTEKSNICINPFSTIRNINEEIGVLSLIVSQMVWSSTGGKPSETQMSILKLAIREVWHRHGPNGDINKIKQTLLDFKTVLKRREGLADKEILTIATELAFNLTDFTSNGCYGKWFNGRSNLNLHEDPFVTLELEELKAQEELFKVVILQIVNYVTQELYFSDRSQKHLIVFDEAWQWFVEGSFLGQVVEHGYRLARKYLGSFVTIFQSLQDLRKFGKGGDVINDNSAFKFFLKSDYLAAKKDGLINFDPFIMNILESVDTQKGRYSEAFIKTPFGMGVARLPSDLFSHLIFTSDPRENRQIEEVAKRFNLDRVSAVKFICNRLESNRNSN